MTKLQTVKRWFETQCRYKSPWKIFASFQHSINYTINMHSPVCATSSEL